MDFSKENTHELDRGVNHKIIYSNKQNNNNDVVKMNNFINAKKSTPNYDISDVNADNIDKSEFKRDDSKWKFNKNELLERKKKLLKDKSHLKKVKK